MDRLRTTLLLALALAAPLRLGAAASGTCDAVKSTTEIAVDFDKFAIPRAPYAAELADYWSTGCSDLKPACVIAPSSAQEVATVLKILQASNESFAIKSGGFSANPTWASVSGGPLISTRNLNEVKYDAANKVVRVGPGNSWNDVQKVLDPLNVTVAGGRVGAIGVGGYMVGGGFSFLSTQHGWAVNTLSAVELVLANGTIVTASSTQHPDLFAALKGGGNNFGIVTTFIMQAIPIGQVWGGLMIFPGGSSDRTDAMLSAIANFTASYADHPEAGIIATVELVLYGAIELWVVFFFYDGPTPGPGVFDNFLALHPLINTCKTQPYADLLSGNSIIVLHGTRYHVATETAALPPPAASREVLRSYYDHWANVSRKYNSVFGLTTSMAIQPLPKGMAAIAREKGGDLLDLDPDVDRLIFEYDLSYLFATDDATVDRATLELTDGMKALVDGFLAKGVTRPAFLPLFANDVFRGQDYYARLRPEKRALAHDVSLAVDPRGLFRTRTGGWKP